ncbi:hypothetical protein GCM10010106_41790 [Thermopolyspora flexuosa]|uniref:caspase, EACC1-associated type n=1 Tax=Thermopolyspora flexuosa TaxID=103836 RepID=UPI0016682236|nr:caspase family protein [Thermopolyspora flexuosa]GGM89950.1 hypothetical protein GCM10010106_41790 [Thermopolyspora flexuosa]
MIGAEPHLLLASPGTRVLLVGSGTYAADSLLPEVDAVPGTVADLGRCLVERAGLHPANLTTLIDPPSPLELGAALVETAEQATDVLMVYYVGHGLIGADNELYLATRATVDLTKGIAEHQALPYATLRQALAHCTASIIVVVLDCCFAGRAKTLSRDAWRRLLDATPQGTYLLAAAERDQSAFAPQGNRHTAFTGALIDLLDNGDPTAPALLDLDDIYRCLSRALPEQGYPAPRRRATDHGDRRPVAPNPARLARRKPQEGAQDDAGRTAGPGGDGEGEFSPYRGLAAFTAGDADYFFGREELTRTLVDRVAEQATTGDPLVVIGPSGSGKSSLLRAGLIATLRRSSGTEVILLTPGPDPLGALAARLAHLDGSHTGDLRARLEKDPAVLRQVVADALDGRQAVIIVDQFEELFTVCGDERQRQIFIQALQVLSRRPAGDRGNATVTPPTGSDGAAVTTGARPAAVVVLGVRSDFFGHCARYRELVPVLEHPVVVGPMSPAQLRQAIEGPAHRAGLSLEPGLVDLILQDLGTEPVEAGGADRGVAEVGVLPLLSHALLVTWQHREGRMLTMAGYRATGGIHRALARTADATLEQLDLGARAIARQMLTRLVRLGDGRDDTRRVMPLDELLPARESAQYGKARQVLDRFVKARLLTVDANAVQLAHEALIRAWPRLRLWIDTDRSTLLVHQALSQDADEWHRNNRDPAYLYQGVRLAGAQQAVARWQSDPGRYPVLMGIAREFLHAGEAAANRQARRRSLTVLALAISLVLALTGTGIATKFALDAGEESARSLSRQLAAQSESIADTDIRLARQLATTAWDIAQTEDARLSLIKSLLSPDRVTLTGHTQPLSTAVFSPDGKLLATASNDNTARLWDTTTGKTIATLTGHTNHVTDIAFSPDGKLLATASHDNTARLWDTTGKHITALTGHTNSVTTVAFSPDGKLLATASDDDTARLWDITTGEVTILTGHNHSVTAIAFSPDGKLLATTSYDNTARLWDTISGEPIATLTGHTGSVTAVAFRPDGKLLATASHDNTARLWNTTGKHITTLTGHTDNVTDIAFSPDGELLATTSYDNTARLWDTTSGEPIATLTGHTGSVTAVAFRPDGKLLATASDDNTARLWDTTTGEVTLLTGHMSSVTAIAFSPDGKLLATASDDNTARLWDTTTGKTITTLTGHTDSVTDIAFSPDGKLLATASHDNTARLWDTTGKHIATLTGHTDSVTDIAFSPDGKLLATASHDNTARLWDTTGKHIATLTGHEQWVTAIAFSPDGKLLATASRDNTARLWETTGKHIATLTGHEQWVTAITFSPDGKLLATASDDNTARLWDTTGKHITTLTGHKHWVTAITFSPDGKLLATASADATARVWDTTTGKTITTLTGHKHYVTAITFSPDGKLLATVSHDNTARLWDTTTGKTITTLTGHKHHVTAITFSPDGKLLATASADGTGRIWNVEIPSDPFLAVCSLTGGQMGKEDWEQYLPGEPYREVCP